MLSRTRSASARVSRRLWLPLAAWVCVGADCEPTEAPDLRPIPQAQAAYRLVALCTLQIRCRCEAPIWDGHGTCGEAAIGFAERWIQEAEASGLAYDGACLRSLLWESGGGEEGSPEKDICPVDPVTGEWRPCERECQIFSGDREEGQSCVSVGRRMSTCVQGLACGVDGVCHSPCSLPEAGGLGHRCGPSVGDFTTPCSPGLACASGTCVEAAERGGSCGGQPCSQDDYCDGGTCRVRLDTGQSCLSDETCTGGVCDMGLCAAPQPRVCVGFTW